MPRFSQCFRLTLILIALPASLLASNGAAGSSSSTSTSLFGYNEIAKQNLDLFPQWLSVIERHLVDVTAEGSCKSTQFNRCHLRQWQAFLESITNQNVQQQIQSVNRFANSREYILDRENYGVTDYWATPKEFLTNNGDCEDFAIIKMLSLKWLGYDTSKMRVVVVQDTNLRIQHAVMAINSGNDILILDNQIEEVISHNDVFHYVPVYSVNENNWWMHVPN